VFLVDLDREISCAFLSAGPMTDSYSTERHQCYADLALRPVKNAGVG
jgi:hypothetical protein